MNLAKDNQESGFDPIGKIGCLSLGLPAAGVGLLIFSPVLGGLTIAVGLLLVMAPRFSRV